MKNKNRDYWSEIVVIKEINDDSICLQLSSQYFDIDSIFKEEVNK